MRIVSVVGARPQFVKLSSVCSEVSDDDEHLILHTGQHYNYEMSESFFEAFGMPAPNKNLEVGSSTHGVQTAAMLAGIEAYLIETKPDWVLVFGDTNSTLAGGLAATKLDIPVAHLEAGLRSWNRHMPEEINRILTDHASTLCLAPTQQALRNLQAEGLGPRSELIGDVTVEIVSQMRRRVSADPPSLPWDYSEDYWFATLHRQELMQDTAKLREVLAVLDVAPVRVYLSAHPGLKRVLASLDMPKSGRGSLHIVEPLTYPSIIWAMLNSRRVVTDSGGLQKEAYLLEVPCVTIRAETEWVETVQMGWNTLIWDNLTRIAEEPWVMKPASHNPELYGDGRAARRTLQLLRGAI